MMHFSLRPYQTETIANVKRDWQQHDDVLAVLPTGAGKTQTFIQLLIDELRDHPNRRGLVIAHREELITQPIDRIRTFWPEWAYRTGAVMAEYDEVTRPITVATIQTLSSQRRLERLLMHGPIDYLVTDEAHHSCSQSYMNLYQRLREANPNLKHLGVTATPIRADGDGLSKVFQHVSQKISIKQMIQQGYLVPIKSLGIATKISLKGVKTVKNADGESDFSKAQLRDVFETDNCFDLVVETHKKYAEERKAICFTVSVEGAHTLTDKFNEAGIKAFAVDGTTPKQERRTKLAAFANGEYQVFVNCMVATEGFDCPDIQAVHMVRPTKSDSLYLQAVGRGLRTAPGKIDCLILDYAPAETRNIKMAGDVLGVPAELKQEMQKQNDEAEEGEVFEGFTFDGIARGLEGDPLELVARELNYLETSPYAWDRQDGFFVLPIKPSETLVITPVKAGKEHQDLLLVISEKASGYGTGTYYSRVEQLLDGQFDMLSEYAQTYAEERGDPTFADKGKSWRKRGVTEGQIKALRKFGFGDKAIFAMTADQASKTISWRITRSILAKAGWR